MIEVVARLEGGPAFFAGGEKIGCVVTFRNVARPDSQFNSATAARYSQKCLYVSYIIMCVDFHKILFLGML